MYSHERIELLHEGSFLLHLLEGCDAKFKILRVRVHKVVRILIRGTKVKFCRKWIPSDFAKLSIGIWKFRRQKS